MREILYRSLKPEGWLRDQLTIQSDGLTGNLDRVWKRIYESAWTGGSLDGWETLPYWLDGYIPMAFLLRDEEKMNRCRAYIGAIVAGQKPDGWICPCTEEEYGRYDTWAVILICKVLSLYCELEDDPGAERALYRAMHNYYDLLSGGKIRLFDWGKARWFEALIPLMHLYGKCPEDWMMDLGRLLRRQGTDYPSLTEMWKVPDDAWRQETHIVNIAMMLKYEALCSAFFGEPYRNRAEEMWQILEDFNGTAAGTFTGDECLSGLYNQHGTELCSVVELMYSCEWLYRLTGDNVWADRLEKIALNALPAAFSDDMWTHQYDQMVNQPACIQLPGKSYFRTNDGDAHLFGLEPHFRCCTANMGQGWPKLALNALYKTDEGILISHMMPCSAAVRFDGIPVQVRVESRYPFRMNAGICIKADAPVSFELALRCPDWADTIRINGEETVPQDHVIRIRQRWEGSQSVSVVFETQPVLTGRPHGMKVLNYGPLVFSLPVDAEYRKKTQIRNRDEWDASLCDYELYPRSEWRYGFAGRDFRVEEREVSSVPFSSLDPALTVHARMKRVRWEWEKGYDSIPAAVPDGFVPGAAAEEKVLIPYGCAKLRMTEMAYDQDAQ